MSADCKNVAVDAAERNFLKWTFITSASCQPPPPEEFRSIEHASPKERAIVHKLLVDARNTLERDGWTGGWGGTIEGRPTCVFGALALACGLPRYSMPEIRHHKLMPLLVNALGFPTMSTGIHWNDGRCRSLPRALARFDKAIALTAPEPAFPVLSTPDDQKGMGDDVRQRTIDTSRVDSGEEAEAGMGVAEAEATQVPILA